ncbi:hypothetical protein [Aquimarina brevivitae]|uniref:Uncharacterized protein n=1 Tax=Aquimarina brevivitae TaxID=323412 RepID=A0A4V2F4V3_9FLAO|nr:hypothetical protein [Aquimarina brevivitae]RZS90619.1 hypothetical protein EV197_3147 [Aquimarina brevivitae]
MSIKQSTILILLMAFISLGMTKEIDISDTKIESSVYVCGASKIYHRSKSHVALGRCKSGIKKMTETKAKDLGKRVCRCRS